MPDEKQPIDQEIKHGNHIDAGPLTIRHLEYVTKNIEKTVLEELDRGYQLIKKYPRSVSFFGSARFHKDSPYYAKAESLAGKIVRELKYTVVTGGGPGIMEAGNKGAYDAGGVSVGFTIRLPKEQQTNPYVTESADFQYFFDRKTLLFFSAEAYIYFPGGFGTFDELFSLISSIQTHKVEPAPVILFGVEFWKPIVKVLKEKLLEEYRLIDAQDLNLWTITDSEDEVIDIVRNTPYRNI